MDNTTYIVISIIFLVSAGLWIVLCEIVDYLLWKKQERQGHPTNRTDTVFWIKVLGLFVFAVLLAYLNSKWKSGMK